MEEKDQTTKIVRGPSILINQYSISI